ncbi:MAG: uL30 family ribosomal protein [Thermoplasmata archaeon]|nr:uL30 family ribosomal protein [Thermoplasmata archaeon]
MGWMIIRVRGGVHARGEIVATLDQLHLTRPNHATVVPEEPSFRGMITKVEGYVTWGEADAATVELLLKERGAPLSIPDAATKIPTAEQVVAGGLSRAGGIKPMFRLRAPKGGWRSTKKPFARGGALGYRGAAINDIARKMI